MVIDVVCRGGQIQATTPQLTQKKDDRSSHASIIYLNGSIHTHGGMLPEELSPPKAGQGLPGRFQGQPGAEK